MDVDRNEVEGAAKVEVASQEAPQPQAGESKEGKAGVLTQASHVSE